MSSTTCHPTSVLCVENLQKLLREELGNDLEVKHFTTEALTQSGENYGSTILAVEVSCSENSSESLQNLSLVAKLMPPSQFLCDAFDINITFSNEVRTYVLIKPEHQKLQEEKQIPPEKRLDIFPRFYGARTNFHENLFEEADECAILLMENLKTSGFHVPDRKKGLNLKHMEFGVTCLARFHALTIALKLNKPQVFKETVLKACCKFQLGRKFDTEKLISKTVSCVESIPECLPYIKQIEDKLRRTDEFLTFEPKEPFATLLHNDLWVNNMLFKYSSQDDVNCENPNAMKFVDFQIIVYDSPIRDLLFFLFTSSEDGLLDKHLDFFLSLYHKELLGYLTLLECDTKDFNHDKFQEELVCFATKEFTHILYLLKIVSAENTGGQTLEESEMKMYDTNVGEIYKRRVKTLVRTFVERGWL
ncbi:hypothetical protein C0J52_07355 [Blattella germanica]|nr:hypothetical protein C0J52_07355 [Blattella germanica]